MLDIVIEGWRYQEPNESNVATDNKHEVYFYATFYSYCPNRITSISPTTTVPD